MGLKSLSSIDWFLVIFLNLLCPIEGFANPTVVEDGVEVKVLSDLFLEKTWFRYKKGNLKKVEVELEKDEAWGKTEAAKGYLRIKGSDGGADILMCGANLKEGAVPMFDSEEKCHTSVFLKKRLYKAREQSFSCVIKTKKEKFELKFSDYKEQFSKGLFLVKMTISRGGKSKVFKNVVPGLKLLDIDHDGLVDIMFSQQKWRNSFKNVLIQSSSKEKWCIPDHYFYE